MDLMADSVNEEDEAEETGTFRREFGLLHHHYGVGAAR